MEDAGHSGTTSERGPGTMSERRRERVRMYVSREAARLFWGRAGAIRRSR